MNAPEEIPTVVLPFPGPQIRPDYAWIDLEASSLSYHSYPIEAGWAFDDLSGGAFLIRPADNWEDWSAQAEATHGITMEELHDRGIAPREAAERLNDALASKLVFSDTADLDGGKGMDMFWLRRLYQAAGRDMSFRVTALNVAVARHLGIRSQSDVDAVLPRIARAEELAVRHHPHTHRAAEDAICMAAAWRMTVDDGYFDAMNAHDGTSPLRFVRG